jgi:prepilin-type N-terminal cleavage/methylation domain-containing protein
MRPYAHSSAPASPWPTRGLIVLGVCFLAAAAGKLLRVEQLTTVITYLLQRAGAPGGLVPIIAILIPAFEVLLAMSLIVPHQSRRTVAWITLAVLLLFSAILIALWIDPHAPACGYLGALAANARHDAAIGLARNAAMIALVIWFLSSNRTLAAPTPHTPRTPLSHPRAFTLLELLLSIAVLALLIAILLPYLAAPRRSARALTDLSVMRSLVVATDAYAASSRDAFPFFATPGDLTGPVRIRDVDFPAPLYFFTQYKYWTTLLIPDHTDLTPAAVEFPGMRDVLRDAGFPDWVVATRYRISATVWAAPPYWSDSPPSPSTAILNAQRTSDVRFPAQKGLLLDIGSPVLNAAHSATNPTDASIALCDASARVINWHTLDDSRVSAPPHVQAMPILTTRHGLLGVDLP